MAFIQQINPDDATGELQNIYETCKRRAGYIANILKLQSLDAAVLRESIGFYIQLMKSPNALCASHREMLATVVSHANDCYY